MRVIDKIRTMAPYLPQFHSISENDEGGTKNFTKWTKATKTNINKTGF